MHCLQEMYMSTCITVIIRSTLLFNWKVMSFPIDLQGRGAVKDGSHSDDTRARTCKVHHLMCDA